MLLLIHHEENIDFLFCRHLSDLLFEGIQNGGMLIKKVTSCHRDRPAKKELIIVKIEKDRTGSLSVGPYSIHLKLNDYDRVIVKQPIEAKNETGHNRT